MRRWTLLAAGLALTMLPLAPGMALAQGSWPERPVRVVMPFAPGGNGDTTIRIIAARMQERLGQPMVVENRPGAGGSIGTAEVARARPDGYALLGSTAGPLVINPLVQANIPYHPLRSFAAIGMASRVPMVVIVNPRVEARTLPELIALSRARPGSVTIGTSGIGGANHLPLELLNAATGAGMVHVPYRGGGAAVPDLVAGNVAGLLTEFSSTLDLHREGRARILAVASARRNALLPDVPTFIEAGLPGFTAEAFVGLAAPAGTPEPVLARLQAALAAALAEPETQAKLQAIGAEVATPEQQTPAGFAAYLEAEIAKARRGVEIAGLKPE
jgi:tripartite-type tricarboxylate transporter receptor subunit TctC